MDAKLLDSASPGFAAGPSQGETPPLETRGGFIRQRFARWWQSRLPMSDRLTLTQRNVYILPTRPGFMLAATLLVLLVASINYQLNLGYLLTFMLAGSAVVGMHVCHGTLRGLSLQLLPPEPTFAGSAAPVTVQLHNPRRSVRHAIGFSVLGADHWAWTDVPAQGQTTLQVACAAPRRGRHRLPTLTAETRFPLGTFRVWAIWRPAAQLLVYPQAELRPPPLPPGEPRGGTAGGARTSASGEFDGVRAYRRGDPMKLVVWKKAAKAPDGGSNALVSRDSQQAQRHELWLDWQQTGLHNPEQRLSRLCAWVLMADRLGLDYGLRLQSTAIPPSSGEAHKRHCLETLALA